MAELIYQGHETNRN